MKFYQVRTSRTTRFAMWEIRRFPLRELARFRHSFVVYASPAEVRASQRRGAFLRVGES